MKTEAICPACKFKIPLLRIVIAPTPYSIKCPVCLSTVRLQTGYIVGIILGWLAITVLVVAGALLLMNDLIWAIDVVVVILLILGISFEIAFGLFVCNTPSMLTLHKLGNEFKPKARDREK